jgi:cytochrome c-type biogenesis protein CcmH
MILWLVIMAITAGVLVALFLPLFREYRRAPSRAQRELAIYRDQLAELRREVDAGRISATDANLAETEIQRKILASADTADLVEALAPAAAHGWAAPAALVAIATVLPIGALAVYLSVGSPGMPSYRFDPVRAAAVAKAAEEEALVEKLVERLRQEPNSLKGWVLLAGLYRSLQRDAEAAQAYARVYALSGNDVRFAGDYAEALVAAADGDVAPEARALFEQVLKSDASEPRARFYLALAKAQAGQAREAIAMWRSLEVDSPSDAAWLPDVRKFMTSVAAKAGIDPASVPATSTAPISSSPGPTADDVAAAQSMNPADQEKMIRDMVEGLAQRLAAKPDDLEGWKRLGQSYVTLNEPAKALQAYARAVALAPTDIEILADYANATLTAPGPAEIPSASIETLRQVLKTDASNATALWLVGLAESQANHTQEAAALWTQLLARLQPDTPAYRAVQSRIGTLGANK